MGTGKHKYKEECNGDNQERKWMDNVQEHMEKKISFPTTYDQHTKQQRVETSDSSLIVILKMMEERKEGLDKSKTCCLHGPWPSKPIDQTRNYLYLVSVSVCCCSLGLLFCDDSVIYTVLSMVNRYLLTMVLSASRSSLLSFYPLNVASDCFIILDKVF